MKLQEMQVAIGMITDLKQILPFAHQLKNVKDQLLQTKQILNIPNVTAKPTSADKLEKMKQVLLVSLEEIVAITSAADEALALQSVASNEILLLANEIKSAKAALET